MKGARVLVTGANGFLGRNVVPLLIGQSYVVHTLGRSDSVYPKTTHHRINLAREAPVEAVRNVDAIVHLASDVSIARSIENPAVHLEKNLAMTLNLLEACRATGHKPLVIYLSTDRVYGRARGRVTEQSPTFPIEPYTGSKIMGEIALVAYHNLYDIPYVGIRASAFFGPHQPRRSFISDVIHKMIENTEITVGPLKSVKNFTYVDNVASAVLAALKAPRAAQNCIYNIGGKPLSLLKVLTLTQSIIEKRLHKKISIRIDRSIRLPQQNEIGPFTLSSELAQKKLHWKQSVTLESGLARTVDYFLRPENQ